MNHCLLAPLGEVPRAMLFLKLPLLLMMTWGTWKVKMVKVKMVKMMP